MNSCPWPAASNAAAQAACRSRCRTHLLEVGRTGVGRAVFQAVRFWADAWELSVILFAWSRAPGCTLGESTDPWGLPGEKRGGMGHGRCGMLEKPAFPSCRRSRLRVSASSTAHGATEAGGVICDLSGMTQRGQYMQGTVAFLVLNVEGSASGAL